MGSLCLRHFVVTATLAALLGLVPVNKAFAKTDKYNRTSTTTGTDDATDDGTSGSPSKKSSSAATPGASPNPDKKVDISDLENRYWTAKDTEFNVVQNRLYTKAKRFAVTIQGGTNLSDSYTNNFNLGVNVNYYFTERTGIELYGWMTSATDADFVKAFGQQFGLIPDHNLPQGYIGADYNWIPIYAKLSLLEKKILYFDMSFSPGLGVTFLKSDTFSSPPTYVAPNAVSQGAATLALDIAQQVFIDEHWAIRLDLRNHFYEATTYSAASGNAQTTKFTYNAIIMFGVTYFLH